MPVLLAYPFNFKDSFMEPIKITLADKEYEVSQLNLGQMRDLSIGITLPDATDPQDIVRRSYARGFSIITVALREKYPEMTPAALEKLLITSGQLRDATSAILKFSGLILSDESATAAGAKPGEAAGAT
jgi:hypothetical protein